MILIESGLLVKNMSAAIEEHTFRFKECNEQSREADNPEEEN
jgi:hypothetical protein